MFVDILFCFFLTLFGATAFSFFIILSILSFFFFASVPSANVSVVHGRGALWSGGLVVVAREFVRTGFGEISINKTNGVTHGKRPEKRRSA